MTRSRTHDHLWRNSLAFIALLLALGGCGDSDEPESTGATDVDAVAPAEPGDPDATAEPSVADVAEFPILTRGAVDQQVPAIRGSSEQTVEQWLHTVVNDVAGLWQQTFNEAGDKFKPVNYIVYTRPVPGCGGDRAGLNDGPAYCISERKVYMSVPFFQNFYGQFGDTAMAIPIAHELGHHVQNNLKVFRNPKYRSIEIELGADCLAGIWAHSVLRAGPVRAGRHRGGPAEPRRGRGPRGHPGGRPRSSWNEGTAGERLHDGVRKPARRRGLRPAAGSETGQPELTSAPGA